MPTYSFYAAAGPVAAPLEKREFGSDRAAAAAGLRQLVRHPDLGAVTAFDGDRLVSRAVKEPVRYGSGQPVGTTS